MLQVKNLTKIYKTKNGTDVRALDGVCLQFPETGMVFLLGKSGSGKSTLLNVCGGLDSPTSGEITVKGRSSKNFSQSDFDSYRNTFIGFIFQEYNILNEFSVEDNIALALELQGKPKDKAAVRALLEEVDLKGLGKRKPNTLSGGQKQRIAIARALVKKPEIIMADEPTGALDSATGKQVFDTLKKLSKNKLVIVVSHDRDFAEQYGDRIIELKDGKILSDVIKTQVEQESVTENISTLGDILCIKRGEDLTDKEFDTIKTFLKKSKQDVVIASNEKDIQNFKKASRINDSGEKEVFTNTQTEKITVRKYSPEESRFIRSKLPLKHAIKIGLSGLKSKPIRLLFTILLCTIAFILFGLLSTLSFYDSESTFRETLITGQNDRIRIEKQYTSTVTWYYNGEEESKYTEIRMGKFSEAELSEFKTQFGEDVFGGITADGEISVRSSSVNYWRNNISAFAYLPENNSLRNRINGEYPKDENGIVISSYMAESLFNCKLYNSEGDAMELSAPEDLIGKTIKVNGVDYNVTGILDAGTLPEKFNVLKTEGEDQERLLYDFMSVLRDGLYQVIFVHEDALQQLEKRYDYYSYDNAYDRTVSLLPAMSQEDYPQYGNGYYYGYTQYTDAKSYLHIIPGKTAPERGETIVTDTYFYELASTLLHEKFKEAEYTEEIARITQLPMDLRNGGTWEYDEEKEDSYLIEFTEEEMVTKTKELISILNQYHINLSLKMKFFSQGDQTAVGDEYHYSIIGIYMTETDEFNGGENRLILNDAEAKELWEKQKLMAGDYVEAVSNYKEDPNALFSRVYVPYDHSQAHTDIFWQMYTNEKYDEVDSRIYLAGSFVDDLRFADEIVKSLSQVFLYVGLVLAVFAALLFSNFISVSISQKKRDIGILRAVGARSFDVFKIFFSESFFISLICVVLSSAGCIILCNIINAELSVGIGASLLVFGPLSFGVLILIALLTAVIATFLPVNNAARKKPVDSIRAL